jgi:hypothetical protein
MFSSLYSVLSDLAAEYPKTFGAITSAISVGGILAAGWAYWRRPVINARFGKNEGSHGLVMVDYRNGQGSIVRQEPVKYFRLRIKNVGLTTLKECGAQLIKATRRVVGEGPDVFDTDTYQFGWANYSQSDTRNIPSFGSFHIDLATLRMMPNGRSEFFLAECFDRCRTHWPIVSNHIRVKHDIRLIYSSPPTTHARGRFQLKSCLILRKPTSNISS